MNAFPEINEYELETVVWVLGVTNPGRAETNHITDVIRANWPFNNIAVGGWVAYVENPEAETQRVRLALTPYTQNAYLNATMSREQ